MKAIYPKIDDKLKGIHALRKYVNKYKGIELQITKYDKNTGAFEFEEPIRTILEVLPNVKEIIVHMPLFFCDIEMFSIKNNNEFLEKAKLLSLETGIKINFLFHVKWNFEIEKMLVIPSIMEMLNIIKGFNINILLENDYLTKDFLCPLKICKLIGSNQLKTCLNICHIHCYSNIMNTDVKSLLNNNLNKKDASKYIYCIHFSKALNNDGYKDLNTHSRMHDTKGSLIEDVELLFEFGMYDTIFITDINEENYETREEQIEEITSLEDIYKLMK